MYLFLMFSFTYFIFWGKNRARVGGGDGTPKDDLVDLLPLYIFTFFIFNFSYLLVTFC